MNVYKEGLGVQEGCSSVKEKEDNKEGCRVWETKGL